MNLPLLPCSSKRPKLNQGFSLVELLVVIAILAIVLGLTASNMRKMVLNNRVKVAVNTLVSGLEMARNEAVTRNKGITFCPSNQQGSNCAQGVSETGYQYGALVMESNKVIHRTEAMPSTIQVVNNGSIKIDFKSNGSIINREKISVTGVTGTNIKRTICMLAVGLIYIKEDAGDHITCP